MMSTVYYRDKLSSLRDIFGDESMQVQDDGVVVAGRKYPVIDDVIILLDPRQYTTGIRARLGGVDRFGASKAVDYAPDIQSSFGMEWQTYPEIMPEHAGEFREYFDLVDIGSMREQRICDLGCGCGRWSYHLASRVRELILVDFSEAIFVARKNLAGHDNCLFFMGDLKQLPFRNGFADFLMCLGVLHHLPTNALAEVRHLRNYAERLLIYLYYSLDNRPWHFRCLLKAVTLVRRGFPRICNDGVRRWITGLVAIAVYLPLILAGSLLKPLGADACIPLYDGYRGKSLRRIRQDVYDRFFTRIEQRFSRDQIAQLQDSFSSVVISNRIPYWHFLCYR